MSRLVAFRLLVLASFVAFLGGSVSGQSSSAKTAQKKAAARSAAPVPPPSDIRVQTKYTSGVQVSENATYVKGERQRVEFPGVVSIEQCDLGQTLVVNPAAKTYLVTRHGAAAPPAAAAPAEAPATDVAQAAALAPQKAPASSGGIVTYTTTVNDTGERKQMFGREARHITTAMTKSASASACDRTPLTVEVDGWYVDFPAVPKCRAASAAPALTTPKANACVDRVESQTVGAAMLGFPVAMKTTTKTGEGEKQEADTASMEVTSLELTTLDAALFNVPAGYTEVKSNADLMATFQGGGGLADALAGSTADGTSAAAPKRAGAVRIGVLEPVDRSNHQLPTRELRQELASAFQHKAPYEALALSGTSVAEVQNEAARMECDYVLYAEITDIKTSKPGRMSGMLKKVSRDGPPRDVHEVKLDYRLYPVGMLTSAPAFSDSAKATSGGGFDIRSAVHLAVFAGSLYMRFSGLGLLSPMLMRNLGGGLGPLAASGLFDPRMTAMSSMSQLFGSSGLDALGESAVAGMPAGLAPAINPEIEIRQTVDTALVNAAKGTIEQLKKSNRK